MASFNDSKRNYFLKLKEGYLFEDELFDTLMGLQNGRDYMIIYLMLCMLAKNSEGVLGRRINEEVMIIYDIEKIRRYCKYFDSDTIRCALQAFEGLGLIERQPDGLLFVTRAQEMVKSETGAAERMRQTRSAQKQIAASETPPQIEEKPARKKKPAPQKIEYADGVRMTEDEYNKLIDDFGQAVIAEKIEALSYYIGSKGDKYKSHYATIRAWLHRDGVKPHDKQQQKATDKKDYSGSLY